MSHLTVDGCCLRIRGLTQVSGNLSVRSLVDVVRKEHFVGDSEYMQTVLVAVPKCVLLPYYFASSHAYRTHLDSFAQESRQGMVREV